MRKVAAAGVALFIALTAAVAYFSGGGVPPEELVRRCEASHPAWNGYQEEIKVIGASPVAQWHGRPVALAAGAGETRLSMALDPPWDGWEAALPILLMDPSGAVYESSGAEREGPYRVYRFPPVSGAGIAPPPWVEIQYPHTRKRIQLDGAGQWNGAGTGVQ